MLFKQNSTGTRVASSIIDTILGLSAILACTICVVVFNKKKFNAGKVFGIYLGFGVAFGLLYAFFTQIILSYKVNKCPESNEVIEQNVRNALGPRVPFVREIIFVVTLTSAILTVFFLRKKGLIEFDVATNLMIGIGIALAFSVILCVLQFCCLERYEQAIEKSTINLLALSSEYNYPLRCCDQPQPSVLLHTANNLPQRDKTNSGALQGQDVNHSAPPPRYEEAVRVQPALQDQDVNHSTDGTHPSYQASISVQPLQKNAAMHTK